MNNSDKTMRQLAFPFGALMIVALMGGYTVPFVIGSVMNGLGLGESDAGLLGTVEILSIALTSLLLSFSIHRHSLRPMMAAAILLCVLSQIISAFIQNYYFLLVARVMVGVGGGILLASLNSLVATSKSPEKLYGWVLAVVSSGFAVILIMLPYAQEYQEQRGLFVAIAVVTLLVLPALRKVPYKAEKKAVIQPGEQAQELPIYCVGCFFFILAVFYVIQGGIWSFSERVALDKDISRDIVGLLLGLSTVLGIAGASSAAVIGTRFGLSLPVVSGFVVSGLSVLIVTQAQGIFGYAAGMLLFGYMFMFTMSFALSVGAAFDSLGRVAVATNALLLIFYSFGPTLYGVVGLANLRMLGLVSFALCVLAAIVVIPTIRRAESMR